MVTKVAVQKTLGGIVRERVESAAGANRLLSKAEQRDLPEFLREAASAVRQTSRGRAPRTDDVVDVAMSRTMKAWATVNPPNHGKDGRYLAKSEINALRTIDASLAQLTQQAYDRASLATGPTKAIQDMARHFRDVGAYTGSAERFFMLAVPQAGRTPEERARAIVRAAGFEGTHHESSPGLAPFVGELESLGHETESPAYPKFIRLVRKRLENLQTIHVDALIVLSGTEKNTGQLFAFVFDGR